MQDAYIRKLNDMRMDPSILEMKKFKQHYKVTTYSHVCHVACMSHRIEKALHLNVDENSMLVGALLHDYYLYDTHAVEYHVKKHGRTHAGTALHNAERIYQLNAKERNIIWSHMWPLNLTHLPKSKEAWIVSTADKICAVEEATLGRWSVQKLAV